MYKHFESGPKWPVVKEDGRAKVDGLSKSKLVHDDSGRRPLDGPLSQSGRSWVEVDGPRIRKCQSGWLIKISRNRNRSFSKIKRKKCTSTSSRILKLTNGA